MSLVFYVVFVLDAIIKLRPGEKVISLDEKLNSKQIKSRIQYFNLLSLFISLIPRNSEEGVFVMWECLKAEEKIIVCNILK